MSLPPTLITLEYISGRQKYTDYLKNGKNADLLYGKTTIDDQIMPREPARGVTEQIDSAIGDVIGTSVTSQGVFLGVLGELLLGDGATMDQRRVHHAGADAVDADAARRELACGIAHDRVERGLGSAIHAITGHEAVRAADGGQQHHRGPLLEQFLLEEQAHQFHRGEASDVEHLVNTRHENALVRFHNFSRVKTRIFRR